MIQSIPRAVARYLKSRPLLLAFMSIGIADLVGKAAVAALSV
ncbi:hypothetical protein [Xenophilus azovorans]|nr:hypothetical protein [Xenophilus azovorans]